MRIAYVARWDISHESGILKKMVSQVAAWQERGHAVTLFAISPGNETWSGVKDMPLKPFHNDNLLTRLTWRRHISQPILDWRPDLVYLRFSTWYPALERVMRAIPTVVEINGDDIAENRLSLPRPLFWSHLATRNRLLRQARGMVFVTRELSRKSQFTQFGTPGLVLGNGFSLGSIPILPPAERPQPRLIFVGYAGCAWHGLDKIVHIARAFPHWKIDVVGTDASQIQGRHPSNLLFHGYLERHDYKHLLASAHAAIGTLALHRKGMEEASPLKTREYLAYGLPTIIAYEDTDFPTGHPLLLQLPNTPDNVAAHLPGIRDFVERVQGARIPRADVAHLDVEVKENVRLKFLERIWRESAC